MGDFSTTPLDFLLANQQKGYTGLHIEQGVPVLDRDLNLLQDLVTAGIRALFTRYVGNGLASDADGFGIVARPAGQNSQDFQITAGASGPGSCLVGGIEVTIPAAVDYAGQAGVDPLTTPQPNQPNPRVDTVYLDVFLVEVDGTTDPGLTNSHDVGMETSVRLMPAWVVRVAEGGPVPSPPDGHVFYPLAELQRPRGVATIDQTMITDLRQRRLTVSDMEQRLSLLERVLLLPTFDTSAFSVLSGVIGQAITLNGSNFDVGTSVVLFDGTPGTLVGTPTAHHIVVTVPGGLTSGGNPAQVHVTVRNAGGEAVTDGTFEILASPVFAAPGSQFTPTQGTPGAQVNLSGFNFDASNLSVRFGSTAAAVVGTPTATQITATVPTGLVPTGQTFANVSITVNTSVGSATSDDTFRALVVIPAPQFAAQPFSQISAVIGQTVQLLGSNFAFPPVQVFFGGTQATVIGAPTASQISVQVPAVPAQPGQTLSVPVTVTTAGGTATTTTNFNVLG